MLSKNNRKEQFRKQEPKKQRFAIKKLTVGVASVLIGFTFMGMSASADTTADANSEAGGQSVAETQNSASNQANSQATLTTPNSQGIQSSDNQTVSAAPASETAAQKYENAVSDAIEQATKAAAAKSGDASVTTPASSSAASASSADDQQTTSFNVKANVGSANEQKLASLYGTSFVQTQPVANAQTAQRTLRGTQTETVTDWQGLVSALNNANTGTININADIVVTNNANGTQQSGTVIESRKNYVYLDSQGSAGAVNINGNNHKITFGNITLALQAKNEKNTDKTWDLAFKDLTIDAAKSSYAPISFYKTSDNDVLTYENVTANLNNRPLVDSYSEGMTVNLNNVNATVADAQDNVVTGNVVNVNGSTIKADGASNVINGTTTVNFAGDNNLTITNMVMGGINANTASANAVYSNKVNFNSGTTTFNVDGDIANKTGSAINANNWMVRASSQDADTVVINQGATVNLNSKSADMRGIWAGRQSTAGQPSYGSLVVNGNLNANMANGHSTAIFAQNLEIGTGADVTIHTKQDNQADGTENGLANQNNNSNSTHQAPITIFLGPNTSIAAPVSAQEGHIINNGNLTVIRDNTNKTLVPLISFGQGLSTNMTLKFVNGEGSTLDLQDNSGTYLDGTEPNAPYTGLITMWGTSGNDVLQFDNPEYINLQRTGDTRGTLIRLEGVDNMTTINGNTPVAQWDQGNKLATPNYAWYVDLVQTQNQWGNYSGTFMGKDQTPNHAVAHNGVQTLYNSNATVKMGKNQGGQQYDKDNTNTSEAAMQLNSFLNNFNYWRPQRIAMGSKLTPTIKDADKYQPEVQTIDGTTQQTLADLNAKDGIKDLIGPNDQTITDLDNIISNVSWYNSATDQAEWNKLMIQPTESKDPAAQKPYAEPQNPTGDLKTTDKSAWAKVTYQDGTVDFVNIPLNITEPMANLYTPSYKPVTVEQGQTATDDPAFTDQAGKDTTAPTGTTFTTGTDTPDWATIDPSNGAVTVKPNTDVTPGAYNIPVTVTYPDKSTDETTVPVIVTKAGQTVTWGDNGAVVTSVDTSKLNAHETTENSQVLSPATVVTAEGYELTDGKISTTATPITIDPSTVSWTTTPNTNVETATAAGKEITASVTVDFTNNDAAKNILGSKNGVVTTNPFTIDAKGAGAKAVTAPVNVALGSALTNEQFNQLVENNIPTDEIVSTTWETKPDANGNGGVIKITFTDKAANGQPTYLNINIPASSITVTTDAETNTPQGQDVSTKVGKVPNPAEGIKNKSDLPDGTKYTWKDTPDVTTAGDKPATVVVSYPDGSKDEVPVTIHVTNPATDADKYTPEGQDVNTKTGELPNPADGIKNKSDLPDGTKYTWKDTPDVTTAGDKPATIVVTYPDGSKDEVPVTIHVTNPATDADKYTPETQPITTPEGKVPDPADGIKNKADLPDGTKYTWTNPDQVAQDVKKPGSHTETITVRYPDGSEDTVTVTVNVPAPEGQNITTDQGKLPNPADAIKNKDQMPDGTTYTWKQEPDVSTPGDHTGVVEVHFPDGTTYEVTVNVHVDAINPDNGGNTNSGNGSIDHQNGTEINNGNMTNANNGSVIENVTGQTQNSATNSTSQQPAKTLPQTGNGSSKFSALAGLSLATFASLFGFAGHDKKRKADK
ncbi:YSIRK-type signal peptide-containing protein [Lactobacillus reuteri]|uniref:Rib/alpha-like domain-containing protein n=1 Tax=Limosilactobacillus reuteri TaxID=1598 RepID=UPI00138F36A7|nr:Rib/alpha-like domain-containing protein [Limosilactobacillus reuteri]NDO56671.1 YSIRK-type signal peptide-containing protein [Limosilactobacillus reuteri]